MKTAQRTLRIGFVIDRWQPSRGGAERALARLAHHLEVRGHDVIAFAARGPGAGEGAPGRLRRVRRGLALSRGARERAFGRAAVDAAQDAGCDVTIGVRHLARVDLYWPHGGSHARSHAAIRAARAWHPGSKPGVDTVEPRGRHRDFVDLEQELLSAGGARRIACVSALVESELAADFPASRDRLVRLENGVDLERFRPGRESAARAAFRRGLGLVDGVPGIAFCAREPVVKGLPVLLAALSRLARRRWTLVVAGTPHAAAWRGRAQAAGLAPERVRVLADVDAATLFRAADLLVHPTWRDTSGLVLLEALACGLPVITTAAAGEAATVRAGGGSVVERPGDVDALAAAIEERLETLRGGAHDPERARAAVATRGEGAWLERLERAVVELAP